MILVDFHIHIKNCVLYVGCRCGYRPLVVVDRAPARPRRWFLRQDIDFNRSVHRCAVRIDDWNMRVQRTSCRHVHVYYNVVCVSVCGVLVGYCIAFCMILILCIDDTYENMLHWNSRMCLSTPANATNTLRKICAEVHLGSINRFSVKGCFVSSSLWLSIDVVVVVECVRACFAQHLQERWELRAIRDLYRTHMHAIADSNCPPMAKRCGETNQSTLRSLEQIPIPHLITYQLAHSTHTDTNMYIVIKNTFPWQFACVDEDEEPACVCVCGINTYKSHRWPQLKTIIQNSDSQTEQMHKCTINGGISSSLIWPLFRSRRRDDDGSHANAAMITSTHHRDQYALPMPHIYSRLH